jgi:hypothetical protein
MHFIYDKLETGILGSFTPPDIIKISIYCRESQIVEVIEHEVLHYAFRDMNLDENDEEYLILLMTTDIRIIPVDCYE